MYQTPPPAPAYQRPQNQQWYQPALPHPPARPAEFQHTGPSAPPLPPKPELRSLSTNSSGSWNDRDAVTSPGSHTPSHYWSPHPPPPGMISPPMTSSGPRAGGTIPLEQVHLLDSGRFPESGQAPQVPSSSYPQQSTISPAQSPETGPYALVPPTPQMRGITPMPQSPYLSPVPRAVDGSSPSQASMSPPFQSHPQPFFSSPSPMPHPPPPPPPVNRPYAATPAPPNHPPPPPPPLPTHHSEPPMQVTHSHTPTPQPHARHLSLPPLPPPPPTPAPSHPPPPPPSTSTPAPPPPPAMPIPSFPQPFGAAVQMHTGVQSWVGGIAPRQSMHFRPHYQPDWNNMPPIPQASPAPPMRSVGTPAPPLVPPPPAVSAPAIQMPTPVVAAPVVSPPPPPLPPHPKHAATSPVVMTHGQWPGAPQSTGATSPNAPPLPPKAPPLPPHPHVSHPKEHSWPFQQEPALPPKEPPLPPKEPAPPLLPEAPHLSDPSSRLSPQLGAMSLEERNEAELREALRMSLAMSPRHEEEDAELARALQESMREVSGRISDSPRSEPDTGLNIGSGAWTPALARAQSPGVESAYQTRPPPPLPSQPSAPATPAQEIVPEAPRVTSSPVPEAPLAREDGPPPPTYEEVTGSQTTTPNVVASESLPPVTPEAAQPPMILGSVASRERNTHNNASEAHSSPNLNESTSEPPVAIEVIPPSAQNSIVRRGRPERSSSEGIPPTHTPDGNSPGSPPRRSTQSPPHATARPRTSSQTRPRPTTEPPRQPEATLLGVARPRVMSASQANSSPVSRLSRASMFFGMSSSNLSLGSNDPPPRRTWAIDEEPSAGNGILLQAPEPPLSILRSRNASDANLQDALADAPPTETLLDGVIYGFRDPDPPTPVPMPAADPPPPNISLDDSGAFHIQTLNFRHLLRLLSHYGSTSLMATPAAIAASKS
ncbi:hypothetical protein FRC12_015628, partial [Ceratobasidium sp. 428]